MRNYRLVSVACLGGLTVYGIPCMSSYWMELGFLANFFGGLLSLHFGSEILDKKSNLVSRIARETLFYSSIHTDPLYPRVRYCIENAVENSLMIHSARIRVHVLSIIYINQYYHDGVIKHNPLYPLVL